MQIVLLSFLPIALGWTGAIHSDIVWDAYHRASVNGRRFLRHHLGSDPLGIAKAATWADSDDAKIRYPNSEDYHFSHTPYQRCSTFDMKRDCGFNRSGRCLVTGIAEMVMRAINPELSFQDRQDAVRFVIHLLADIHQPLHTGFARDTGGVDIRVTVDPVMSLHQLWDFALLGARGEIKVEPPMIKLPDRITTLNSMIAYASSLATESSTHYTCNHAYTSENGEYIVTGQPLSEEYMRSRAVIAQERIAHAASRLAELVDVMAVTFFENKAKLRPAYHLAEKKKPAGISSANTFSVLGKDIQPDEIADLCEESLEIYRSSAVVVTPSPSVVIPQPQLTDIEILENEMEEQAHARAAAKLQSSAACEGIAGVPFESIIFVRHKHTFLLTKKEFVLANPAYIPMEINAYSMKTVSNKKTRYVAFGVDVALFGRDPIPAADVTRVLLYLQGENVPPSEASKMVARGDDGGKVQGDSVSSSNLLNSRIKGVTDSHETPSYLLNEIGRRVVEGFVVPPYRVSQNDSLAIRWIEEAKSRMSLDYNETRFKSLEVKLEYDFFSKLNSILEFQLGELSVLLLKQSILETSKRRFNVFACMFFEANRPAHHLILIDTAIYDGFLTYRIQRGINRLSLSPLDVFGNRGWAFSSELNDLRKLLIEPGSRRMEIISNFVQYPPIIDPSHSFWRVIEYDINTPEASGDA